MVAQVQGGSEVIDAAIRHSWEAGAVAIMLIVMLAGIGYLMRALWNINQRLAERVTNLETQFIDRLMGIVADTTKAVVANTAMLERTAQAISKLELAVEQSLHTQQSIVARIETSPCLMAAAFSNETKEKLLRAQEAAIRVGEKAPTGD